jgi:hypothetical protein
MPAGRYRKTSRGTAGREAERNHLPVDAQVPAGLGTVEEHAMQRVLHQVAPASSGLSLGRSRWMAAACQRPRRVSIASSL